MIYLPSLVSALESWLAVVIIVTLAKKSAAFANALPRKEG